MTTVDLIINGFNLMFLGMGIVFVFLVVLVFSMIGVSRLAANVDGQAETPSTNISTTANLASSEGSRAELVAVISAAIRRYRITHD